MPTKPSTVSVAEPRLPRLVPLRPKFGNAPVDGAGAVSESEPQTLTPLLSSGGHEFVGVPVQFLPHLDLTTSLSRGRGHRKMLSRRSSAFSVSNSLNPPYFKQAEVTMNAQRLDNQAQAIVAWACTRRLLALPRRRLTFRSPSFGMEGKSTIWTSPHRRITRAR